MKSMLVTMLIVFMVALAGCSDVPDSALAMKEAELAAKKDAVSEKLFSVADIGRENGWVDGANYKIQYRYDLVSKLDYAQMVIQQLSEGAEELKSISRSDLEAIKLQLGLSSIAANMGSAFGINSPLSNAILLTKKYPEIADYLNAKNEVYTNNPTYRLIGLLAAFSTIDALGLPEGAPAGTKVPRQITFTYMKTEKGWMSAN